VELFGEVEKMHCVAGCINAVKYIYRDCANTKVQRSASK